MNNYRCTYRRKQPATSLQRGVTFVEVITVTAIVTLVFGGLLSGVQNILAVLTDSRSKVTALTLTNDTLEQIRSLSYNAVGTDGGIPSGVLPQVSTSTLNKVDFTQRILVEYVDDDGDGTGASDSNGITTDYKKVKVTTEWTVGSSTDQVEVITTIVPRSIESDVGGGTLRVNVFDAAVNPLPGASVQLVNTAATTSIDTTRSSNSEGIALFGGAPAGPEYEIFVTRSGYSQDQTYRATTSLPNPSTLPVTVLEADVTTMNFFIDELGSLDLQLYSDREFERTIEDFASTAGVATSSDVVVGSGVVELADTSGTYTTNGWVQLVPYTPVTIEAWDFVSIDQSVPVDTSVRWYVYASSTSAIELVPDSELPGNSSGFLTNQIDIRSVSASVYPNLVLRAELETTDTSSTPSVDRAILSYQSDSTPNSSESVTLVSQKNIGTDSSFQPVPKHVFTDTTDSNGEIQIADVEWDSYTLQLDPSLRVTEACTDIPIPVAPGSDAETTVVAESTSQHTLRAQIKAGTARVANAAVTLSRPGYTETHWTSSCGEVFFDSLVAASDYELEVEAPNYPLETVAGIEVASTTVEVISL